MWALQVPWGERRWLCVHGVAPGTSEAALHGMLPAGAPDLDAVDYAGGRTGSLVFARPEDADAAFALLLVRSVRRVPRNGPYRRGSLVFAHPEDADSAFALLPVQPF